MTILHVSDLHFNGRWFDWLRHRAPPHDVLVISGDLLDLSNATPHRRQIAWVSDWINAYPRPLCVCSGNHDLEWEPRSERWTPAYWLRDVQGPNVWTDGQRFELDGVSLLNIGCTTRPKGGDADIWVVHAPPARTLVATRLDGRDGGDPDLNAPVRHYAPRLILSGHVHDRVDWREQSGPTLLLNPGRRPTAEFPNHILIRTGRMSCQLITAAWEPPATTVPAVRPAVVEDAGAVAG